MGSFGGPHIDDNDSQLLYTTMLCHSYLPPGYEPGRFHLLDLGFWISMGSIDGLPLAISFSGLRYHGGTPPLAPQGVTPSSEAVRIVIVIYPHRNFYDGVSKYPLCSFSNGKPLYIPCEVLYTGYVFIYIF